MKLMYIGCVLLILFIHIDTHTYKYIHTYINTQHGDDMKLVYIGGVSYAIHAYRHTYV